MFRALRSFKVMGQNGATRMVKPGDDVPEAHYWPNVDHYLNRHWIEKTNGIPALRTQVALPDPVEPIVVAIHSDAPQAVVVRRRGRPRKIQPVAVEQPAED